MFLKADGNLGIGTTNPTSPLHVSGTITCTSLSQTSDIRLKDNIESLVGCSEKISKLKTYSYTRKDYEILKTDASKVYYGLIAQEVIDVIPNIVNYDTTNDVYTMDYISLIPFMIETIKEQNAKIQHLENFIQSKFPDYSPFTSNT
jgi:hypothetical protein